MPFKHNFRFGDQKQYFELNHKKKTIFNYPIYKLYFKLVHNA